MRRLLSSVALSAILAGGAHAQEGVTGSEGSLFLLLPTGAQAVGMGQTMVAATPGSEGVWWNPAAISVNILNIGEQQVTDGTNQVIGVILPRDVVFAGSYALGISKRLTAGLNYKLIQLRVDCSGICSS